VALLGVSAIGLWWNHPGLPGARTILRAYADRAPVAAIGGLVQGPCPRTARHLYLAELVRAFPDTHFWALGQLVGDVHMHSHCEVDAASVSHQRFCWLRFHT